MSRRRSTRRPSALVAAVLAALLTVGGALVASVALAPVAAAQDDGYVRLAHFSPDTPAVDVWLTAFRGASIAPVVLRGVSYGNVSRYQEVPAGTYAVAMRAPGAPESSPPILRTTVTVEAGKAYTVAGVGPNAGVKLRVLQDDLTAPAQGQGRIRVVQASATAPVVDVVADPGAAVIARGAEFPSTTEYAEVPAQRWNVQVTPRQGGGEPVTAPLTVAAGAVYSFVVLDKQGGGLTIESIEDAGGSSTMPRGAVETGGGTAAPAGLTATSWALLVGSVALLAVAGARVRPLLRRADRGSR